MLRFTLLGFVTLLLLGCASKQPHQGMPNRQQQRTMLVFTSKSGIRFIRIKDQEFLMGGILKMWPVRKVRVSSYWIAECELTNRQADAVLPMKREPQSLGDDDPMCGRSFAEVRDLIAALSKVDGVRYRLPSEAEWECAARGGLEQAEYPWGNESPYGRSQIESLKTCPVTSFGRNGYGLYCCSGNVSEWVAEPYKALVPDPELSLIHI